MSSVVETNLGANSVRTYIALQIIKTKATKDGPTLHTLSRVDGGLLNADGAIAFNYSSELHAIDGMERLSNELNAELFSALRKGIAVG